MDRLIINLRKLQSISRSWRIWCLRCWVRKGIRRSSSSSSCSSSLTSLQRRNLLLQPQLVQRSRCDKIKVGIGRWLSCNKTKLTTTSTHLHHFSTVLPLLILIKNRNLERKKLIQYSMMISSRLYSIRKSRTISLAIYLVWRSRKNNKLYSLRKEAKTNKHATT